MKTISTLTEACAVLSSLDEELVLCDVGASGEPPRAWRTLAPVSRYLGFDPEPLENRSNRLGFKSYTLVTRIVSSGADSRQRFHLTQSPYCSSTLPPDDGQLSQFTFDEAFRVTGQIEYPATRLDEACRQSGIEGLDWLKLDTQGTDLEILKSLPPALLDRLWVIDVEPGLMAFYQGENTFHEVHPFLLAQGFLIAELRTQRFPKLSRSTRHALPEAQGLQLPRTADFPTCIEGTYLRRPERLATLGARPRDYRAAWLAGLALGKIGYALDLLAELKRCHPQDPGLEAMGACVESCRRGLLRAEMRGPLGAALRTLIKHLLPDRVVRALQKRGV